MKNLENLLSELEFLNSEILSKLEKIDFKKLNEKLEKLDEIDKIKIDFDKEYFENLKKEIETKREELLETFDKEIMLFKKTAEDFERRKNYLLNVLEEIKKENDEIRKEIRIFNKAHLFFTVLIFAAAAAVGFYFGLHHFKF